MPLTNQSHANLLDPFLGDSGGFGTLTGAPNTHMGLSTTTPNPDGTGATEPVGNAYARQPTPGATWNPATVASPSVKDNGTAVTFPQATGNWGTITHAVFYDALTAGNVIAFGALTASKAIDTDDTLNFAVGAIQFQMS